MQLPRNDMVACAIFARISVLQYCIASFISIIKYDIAADIVEKSHFTT